MDVQTVEIIGPDGRVHYRRQSCHPDVGVFSHAGMPLGYSMRVRCPTCWGKRGTGPDRGKGPCYCGAKGCDFERPGYRDYP